MTGDEVVDKLLLNNHVEYNIMKYLEEAAELTEILLKYLNKFGGIKQPSEQEIIDEIGDVRIRLEVISKVFGKDKVKKRINDKLSTYDGYMKEGKYKGRI